MHSLPISACTASQITPTRVPFQDRRRHSKGTVPSPAPASMLCLDDSGIRRFCTRQGELSNVAAGQGPWRPQSRSGPDLCLPAGRSTASPVECRYRICSDARVSRPPGLAPSGRRARGPAGTAWWVNVRIGMKSWHPPALSCIKSSSAAPARRSRSQTQT